MSQEGYYRSLADCHEWKSVVGPCSWVMAAIILVLSSVRPMSAPHKSRPDQTVKKGAPSLARAEEAPWAQSSKENNFWGARHSTWIREKLAKRHGVKVSLWDDCFSVQKIVCTFMTALSGIQGLFHRKTRDFQWNLNCDECAQSELMIWWFSRLKF